MGNVSVKADVRQTFAFSCLRCSAGTVRIASSAYSVLTGIKSNGAESINRPFFFQYLNVRTSKGSSR
jgi:hypothetical protein